MNLPDGLLDGSWCWPAWGLVAVFALYAVRHAPWPLLTDETRLNAWLGMIVALILLWNMKAGVKPGLSLHLLGATVFTLCFDWALAFLGLCAVLAGTTLNGVGGWEAFGINALMLGGVGVAVSYGVRRLEKRFLPHHFFIYVFVNGFFGAGLTVLAVGAASCLIFMLSGVYSAEYLFSEYFPYFLLLGFAEAWLSGMLMTLLVVYRPDWVMTFEDALYLKNK